jgi:hypothetical protein
MRSQASGFGIVALWLLFGAPCASGQFVLEPASKRSNADIFLSGSLTGAKNENTIYSWDIKFSYPKFYKNIGRGKRWLVASPLIEFVANKGTDANPDRAKGAAQFGLLLDTTDSGTEKITEIQWLTDIGGEFDRRFDTQNFTVSTFLRTLFRTFGRNRYAFVPEFEFGTEFGNNFQNKLLTDGSGGVARLYAAFSGYQELGSESIVLLINYQYRGLLQDEIFSKKFGEQIVLSLTTKPRHYVEAGVAISVGEYFSIKPQYKWGSLPPAFTFVDSQYSIGLELKARVAR